MRREHLAKLDEADWKAAYEAGIARAEKVGASDVDAFTYAAVAADLAIADAQEAKEREAAALAETRARLAAVPTEPAKASPEPDVTAELWSKAVARINAERGFAEPDKDLGDSSLPADGDGQSAQAVPRNAAGSAWAKVIERINEGR